MQETEWRIEPGKAAYKPKDGRAIDHCWQAIRNNCLRLFGLHEKTLKSELNMNYQFYLTAVDLLQASPG